MVDYYKIEPRGDTAANWSAANPTLALRELGMETDTKKWKLGDGSTAWNSLAYYNGNVTATKLDDLTAPDDNTDLNASTSKHGLMMKYPNTASGKYLKEDGTWAVPPGGSAVTAFVAVAASDSTAAEQAYALASGGTVCDGSNDQTDITAAQTAAGSNGKVLLLGKTFNIEADITLTVWVQGQGYGSNVHVHRTNLYLDGGVTITLHHPGNLTDCIVWAVNNVTAGTAIQLEATDSTDSYHISTGLLDNVFVVNSPGGREANSIGIRLYAQASSGDRHIGLCQFGSVFVYGFETDFDIYADETGTGTAWVNGNVFSCIVTHNSKNHVRINGTSGGAAGGNQFVAIMMQWIGSENYGVGLLAGNGGQNIFYNIFAWDWDANSPALSIASGVYYTEAHVSGAPASTAVEDSGTQSSIWINGFRSTTEHDLGALTILDTGVNFWTLPTAAGWTETKVSGGGSDSTVTNATMVSVNSSATSGSSDLAQCGIRCLSAGGADYNYINWDKKLILIFNLSQSYFSTNSQLTGYVQLKQVSTIGDLAAKGIGIKITSDGANAIYSGESYGASGRSTTSLGNNLITDARDVQVAIVLDPGVSIKWYTNGTLRGTQSTAGYIPSGMGSASGYLVISAANGSASQNCYVRIMAPKLWQAR